ncbi:DNA-binding transcriptional activator of the SARP family [Streptomyces misionensis]|uniref:DNA-binding transcriptional activator of the SARP family n=1 Tax=Streptomyces misionensis TaxID=67331 RepID=A0A1H4IAM3_9ACTN|nr:AfsR/SARP family transcriptional regulator [Streptomyces misionensis]SEB31107.1 DNA-binding transcriptional activator of the SARP family [Streptomyces misionensis]
MIADIRLLGPLRARIGQVSVVPTAAKPRQLLALLAARVGQIVTVDTLTAELWGEEPPRSAATTLQTYVLQLRRRINAATPERADGSAKETLRTEHGGYRLDIPLECVDLHRARDLISHGQQSLAGGDDRTGERLLSEALALWDGPTLVNVPTGPQLRIESMSMEESRLGAVEMRIEAGLRLGRHPQLLGELARLTAEQPFHEALHAHYMVALYRSGRAGKALEVFRRLRTTLIDELGLEPSPRVQRLHQAILASSPDLDAVPAPAPAAVAQGW